VCRSSAIRPRVGCSAATPRDGPTKGRADRGLWKGPLVAAAAFLVLGAAALVIWLVGGAIGGDPAPAASGTAVPTTGTGPASPPTPSTSTTEDTTTSATETTPALLPDAPSGLTATPLDETAIQLSWTDLSANETGFEIDDGQVTRTAAADAQDLVWDGLTPGQQACFRIRAVGDAGASAWEPATDYVCARTTQPDLVAQPIELFGGDPVCSGASPTFQASALNAGSAGSDDFVVRWVPDGDQPVEDLTSGLPPQGADKHQYTWIRVQTGTHQLVFVVDADDRVPEADEANNESVLTFDVVDCIR